MQTKEEILKEIYMALSCFENEKAHAILDKYVAQQWPVLWERQQIMLDEVNRLNREISILKLSLT